VTLPSSFFFCFFLFFFAEKRNCIACHRSLTVIHSFKIEENVELKIKTNPCLRYEGETKEERDWVTF